MQKLQQQAYVAQVAMERRKDAKRKAQQEEQRKRKQEEAKLRQQLLEAAFDDGLEEVTAMLERGAAIIPQVVLPPSLLN